jgi:hypothetical protein
MKNGDAVRVCTTLSAAYRKQLTDETVALWATSLADFELVDAHEAVQIVSEHAMFMPSLAEMRQAIIECRNDRLLREKKAWELERDREPALPGDGTMTFAEFMDRTPGMRERVEKLKVPGADMRLAAAMGNVEAKIEAGRALARQREEATIDVKEWGQMQPPTNDIDAAAMRTACGVAAGTRAIEVDGVWCCPRCRSPIAEGCAPRRIEVEL